MAFAPPARAQVGEALAFMNPSQGTPTTRGQYRVSGKPIQHEAGLTVPLSLTEKEEWLVHGSLRERAADAPVPNPLWDTSLSGSYRRYLGMGHLVGGTLGVGSASDKPFHSFDEVTLSATAYYYLPSDARHGWFFFLNESNNRQFANYVPIPGVAYFYRSPDKKFTGLFGLPFANVSYQPDPDWMLSFSYFFPTIVNAQVACRVAGPARVFVGFASTDQRYLIAGRASTRERLYFDEHRAFGGIRSPLSPNVSLELWGGYAFARSYFYSEKFFKDRHDRVELNASAVAGAQLSVSL
ncbi:MAG: hypothetical protein HY075_13365 [Deltaproteobacteria bacterium]|nr:hypothetical protein [Deltaproteobacteria bacterium]